MSLLADLQQFTGTVDYHRHPLYRTPMYTDGVRHFFRHAGNGGNGDGTAYWVLDILATEPAIRKQAEDFASITLHVADNKAKLTVDDGNDSPPVFAKIIEYTDCAPGTWRFFWRDGVLMLPREW